MSNVEAPSDPGLAESHPPGTALTAPVQNRVVVENDEATVVAQAQRHQYPASEISRRARKALQRTIHVAEVIAVNPLEESRDRLRALEFLRDTGRVADPTDKARGKIITVKVYARSRSGIESAVEVRAEG